jgi:hypothetical protein
VDFIECENLTGCQEMLEKIFAGKGLAGRGRKIISAILGPRMARQALGPLLGGRISSPPNFRIA